MLLTTQRLTLRKYTENDLDDVLEIFSDNETILYQLDSLWDPSNKHEKFKKKCLANDYDGEYGLTLACVFDNKVIGEVSFWKTGMRDTAEVGYTFNRMYTKKGYATEAMRAVIQHLFEEVHIHRIQANINARNTSSAKLCERLGMRKEAHFLQDYWSKGEWTDSYIYGMLKEDYLKHY